MLSAAKLVMKQKCRFCTQQCPFVSFRPPLSPLHMLGSEFRTVRRQSLCQVASCVPFQADPIIVARLRWERRMCPCDFRGKKPRAATTGLLYRTFRHNEIIKQVEFNQDCTYVWNSKASNFQHETWVTRVGGLNSLGKPWELEMPTVMISHHEFPWSQPLDLPILLMLDFI